MEINKKEIDAIGELFNIGTGSSATALSAILNREVRLSVPDVKVVRPAELDIKYLEPAYGISVDYIKGLEGTNSLLLKKEDVLKMASSMMFMEVTEIDDVSKSAVCELMNQMMGSASTAIAGFLGEVIDISIPKLGEIDDTEHYKAFMYGAYDLVLTVTFDLVIEDFLTTKFVTVMSPHIYEGIIAAMRKIKPVQE